MKQHLNRVVTNVKANQHQCAGYRKFLDFIQARMREEKCELQPEEIKLINLVRVIVQGGLTIDLPLLKECLKMIDVHNIQQDYVQWFRRGQRDGVLDFDERKLRILQSSYKLT